MSFIFLDHENSCGSAFDLYFSVQYSTTDFSSWMSSIRNNAKPISRAFVKAVDVQTATEFHTGIWIWSTLTVGNSHWVAGQPGSCQWMVARENVCFMDLAKMIIEVCVLLVSSQHSACSPDRVGAFGSSKHTQT